MIDYKIVSRLDSNVCTVKIRVYEGEVATENEQLLDTIVPVTRYRRSVVLGEKELKMKFPIADNEIINILNDALAKFNLSKTVITEQKAAKLSTSLRAKILS